MSSVSVLGCPNLSKFYTLKALCVLVMPNKLAMPTSKAEELKTRIRHFRPTMGSLWSSMSEALSPAPAVYLRGRATGVRPVGVRVCLTATSAAQPRMREVCAVSAQAGRRSACDDACHTACNALPDGPGMRRTKAVCRRDCMPSCDQPARVAVAAFERTVGGPHGE
jgi:hypothetical protein